METELIEDLSKKYPIVSQKNMLEKIEDEIKKGKRELFRKLDIENPFYENQQALKEAKNKFENSQKFVLNSFQNDFNSFKDLKKIISINIDYKFWDNEFQRLEQMQNKSKKSSKIKIIKKASKPKVFEEEVKISHKLLLGIWEKDLETQYSKWELKVIEDYIKKLLKKLENWLELVQKIDNLLSDLSIETGVLFDLSNGQISLNDIEQLKKWVEYISKDKGVKELCDMLGRLRQTEESSRKELIKIGSHITEYVPDINSNEEIVGIRLGREIEYTLPQELALLGDSETSILFDMKYIEGKLMCFDMEGLQEKTFEIEKEEIIEVSDKEKLGPMIICVDSSGSMKGSPETIAKAVTLYMATRAIQQKRNCFLINFSTSIETLDISNGMGLVKVIEFLKKSFNGGTDIAPALNHAIKLMKEENYKKSDLLIMSDFIMSSLSDKITKNIESAKIEKNKFYSLSIGNLFLSNKLKDIFDAEWVYNPNNNSIHSIKNVVESINTLAKK